MPELKPSESVEQPRGYQPEGEILDNNFEESVPRSSVPASENTDFRNDGIAGVSALQSVRVSSVGDVSNAPISGISDLNELLNAVNTAATRHNLSGGENLELQDQIAAVFEERKKTNKPN